MRQAQTGIPFYREINEFLASIPSVYRSLDENFFCLRLNANEKAIRNYKPPFRKGFYFIALVSQAGKTEIGFDQTSVTDLNAFLVFQSPGLLYSFNRDDSASGYLLYFKRECFNFFKPELEKEFPFFDLLHTNFFKLNQQKFAEFAPLFEEVFRTYESHPRNGHRLAALKLLTLMYELRDFASAFRQWEEAGSSPQQILFRKFIRLLNNFYLEKRSVEEYADLLHVTANHLSQTVKAESGKNALAFIQERLMSEAMALVSYTGLDIAEIAYQLNFSDPANFGKFFRKHAGCSPLEYRRRQGF